MGFKRPFDCEELQELPFKQARQVDYSNKMTQFANLNRTTSQETDITDDHEGSFAKAQQHETLENIVSEASDFVKDFEIEAPWSSVTRNSIDDDLDSCLAAYSSDFPVCSEFDFSRAPETFEDAYSACLNSSPRRQVPLGANHQASIPTWGRHENKNQLEQENSLDSSSSSHFESDLNNYNDSEEKLLGTCIIPMPDTESYVENSDKAGGGRKDCSCTDEGSVRCVQQHILEARERLRKSLGHERFVNLGFYEMGEEVTNYWTKEEERVFHAVVNSNPASLGQNFWEHLSHVFSTTRSSKEIVSYYFNVFMLRRRAAQNRSSLLDIDSDDDELHGINRRPYKARVVEEHEDSDIESIDQYEYADHGEDTLVEDGDDDDDSDGDGDLGDSSGEATGEDSGVDNVSETHDMKSFNGIRFNALKHFDDRGRSDGKDFTVQDDSCMSFELQADTIDSCDPVETEVALQGSRVKNGNRECFPDNGDVLGDGVDQVYLLDSCDTKDWDTRYTVPIKGVDLLPTCNIIEEIFGQGTSSD